jgi:uncharacterized protein involved in tellurium resistance|tara:strand:+ start:701 stop:880 length:180 start_codon:yes stop_codon:yes gene_type:complete
MKRKIKIAGIIGIVASGINLLINGWHIASVIALAMFALIYESTFHFPSKPSEPVNQENE